MFFTNHKLSCALNKNYQSKTLSKKDFSHFIKYHLNTKTYQLDLSSQQHLDSNILKDLANSENLGAIRYLMSTNAGYYGIVELWKSSTFGSLVSDCPTYERHTGTPLATIKIEIGNTRLYEQYQKKLFKYPLPLLRDFEITFGHQCLGQPGKTMGYKQIILFDHGKELGT